MLKWRTHLAFAVLLAGLPVSAMFADPLPPEYKLGDVATHDIISPGAMRVVNPELSERLKQKADEQVPLVFRQVTAAADEAEADLRASIDAARTSFLAALRQKLPGRMPNSGDLYSTAYANTLREATHGAPRDPPLAQLAPLWVRGVSDEAIVEALLQPLRETMAQPITIFDGHELEPLAVDQPIRLVRVKTMTTTPSTQDLENAGAVTTAAILSSLESTRSAAESYFPADQQGMAQFAATFLRANTFPAPSLTELMRAKLRNEVIAYDTYGAGELIVKKGQTIDRKALAALAVVREKILIETLLTRVEAEPSAASTIGPGTQRLLTWFGAIGLVLLLVLWRWGGRRSGNTEISVQGQPVLAEPVLLADANAESWRSRALLAEQRADRAQEAIRQGALGWMREKIFRSLFHQRADLLATQQMAEAEMIELERRLEQLLIPLQGRIKTYENRIRELEEMLAAQTGQDRRLIDARISRARQQLELERTRVAGDF